MSWYLTFPILCVLQLAFVTEENFLSILIHGFVLSSNGYGPSGIGSHEWKWQLWREALVVVNGGGNWFRRPADMTHVSRESSNIAADDEEDPAVVMLRSVIEQEQDLRESSDEVLAGTDD